MKVKQGFFIMMFWFFSIPFLWASPQKLVIAHRGASGYLPEHTLEGAAMAQGWGVDYIEPDVVLTKDRVPVVLHDITLEMTTDVEKKFPGKKRADGKWYAIDLTLAEIKTLSVHERTQGAGETSPPVFPQRYPSGKGSSLFFKVPTLKEFLDLMKGLSISSKRNVGVYLEIKNPAFHEAAGMDIAVIVDEILSPYLSKSMNMIVQCFDGRTLKRLKHERRASYPLIQLLTDSPQDTARLTREGLREIATYAQGIGPSLVTLFQKQLTTQSRPWSKHALIEMAHELGLRVHPYTVREESLPSSVKNLDDFHQLLFFEWEVDGIFTDFADKAVKFLERKGEAR